MQDAFLGTTVTGTYIRDEADDFAPVALFILQFGNFVQLVASHTLPQVSTMPHISTMPGDAFPQAAVLTRTIENHVKSMSLDHESDEKAFLALYMRIYQEQLGGTFASAR